MPERPEFYLERLVDELLANAGDRLAPLGQAVTDLQLSLELVVVANWETTASSSPSLHLNARQMRVLAAVGAALDVDLYASA